jgi:hypothetical protein
MKTPHKTKLFRLQLDPKAAEIAKIPCIFPGDQGI